MRKLSILVIIIGLTIYFLAYNSSTGTWDQSWLKASERIIVAIRLDNLSEYIPAGGQKIVEINGKLAANLEENKLMWIPLERIPQNLRFAIIAVEDSRYYQHGPVDFQGIARALMVDFTKGNFSEGGSTITQQLAKNLFLNGDKTMERKAEEAVLAYKLEKQFSKEQILEMYLNQIYFGPETYGVAKASVRFFGKTVDKLSLAEAAMLAGIPQNPAKYSPVKNFRESKKRQELVLDRMVEAGFITDEACSRAKKEVIAVNKSTKPVKLISKSSN